jgi:septal ring factor EnvC (AmiA/AmiB activator)
MQANINWVSDLLLKALCAACTILLGIAVSSLQSMNQEIKQLSKSVADLSVSSSVIIEAQKRTDTRIEKMEAEDERIRDKLRDISVKIEVIAKSKR